MVRVPSRRSACALAGIVLLGMGALSSTAQAQSRGGNREASRRAPAPAVRVSERYTVARVDHRYGSRRGESRRDVRECAPVRVVRCEPVYIERCEPVRVERCEPVRCEEPRREYRPVRTGFSLSAIFRF